MTEQCRFTEDSTSVRCIYIEGHGGEHYTPWDNCDHSDAIRLRILKDRLERLTTLHPLSEYQDDDNTVLWWHVPIQEPPYVGAGPGFDERHVDGTRTMCARLLGEGWLTHWSRIPQPELPEKDSTSAVEP